MGRDDMSNGTDEPYDWTDDPNLSYEETMEKFNQLEPVDLQIKPSNVSVEFKLTAHQFREYMDIFGITLSERERWKLRLADYLERKAKKQELQYTRHRQREFGLKMRHEHRLKMLRDQSSEESSST